jgi:uncharacterized protein (TIGR03437 family)
LRAGIRSAAVPRACLLLTLACGLALPCVAQARTLLTEPDQGFSAIYSLIGSARKTLDMTMYELTDTQAEELLGQAAANGVTVRVILDQNLEKTHNTPAYDYLTSHGVEVHWANATYAGTHQKTITVDGATTAIMTLNLTAQYYSTTRDFAVIEDDPSDIAAIEGTFNADFADSAVTPANGDDLVWSPTNSESTILSIINSAQHSLLVENEEMGDDDVVAALASAAARGVLVRVAMTNSEDEYGAQFNQLVAAGARIATYDPDAPLYIHAKVILADYGSAGAEAMVGSENFSNASLNRNRELGLILTDPAILRSLDTTLTADFQDGAPWPGSAGGFSLELGPASLQVADGHSAASTVTAAAFGGFSSAVALSVNGLPAGVTAAFTPASIGAPGTGASILQLAVAASAAAGNNTLTITGTGGNVTETAGLTLAVAPVVAVNAGSFAPGIPSGGWVTIFGANLSPVTDDWSNSVENGKLPTSLDGVTVTVDGEPAYPAYISSSQINAVAPDVAPGSVEVTVTGPNGASTTATAQVEARQPAFFQWGAYAVATHRDYTDAIKSGALSQPTVPAAPGDVITLWGTGFGPTNPAAPDGAQVPLDTTYYTANSVSVTLGNTPVTVYGAALAPGYAGLYEVNIQIPESLPDGDYPVVATVAGAQSPDDVLLTVMIPAAQAAGEPESAHDPRP